MDERWAGGSGEEHPLGSPNGGGPPAPDPIFSWCCPRHTHAARPPPRSFYFLRLQPHSSCVAAHAAQQRVGEARITTASATQCAR